MEDFVDIEKMFAADLAMDMDLSLPLPRPLSPGNSGDEEKKAVGVTGEELGAECLIDIAPNVSKDVWDLLGVIEGDSAFNTHGTNEALSSPKSQDNQIYVIPSAVSENELAFRSCVSEIEQIIKHEEPIMETPVYKIQTTIADSESVKLEDPAMEVPVWTSLPDPVHLFEESQDCKPVVDMDTPVFLANMELPTDVSTPDVDLSFLNNQTLELLPTPALSDALKSVEYSGMSREAEKAKDINNAQTIPQVVAEPTTPPSVAGILRLKTGSEAGFSPGKGAALQLRRTGVKRQLEASKIEVKQENNDVASDGATTTIIITLTGSSTSPTTNISCVAQDVVDGEVPLKKAKLGEKYIDMRRKNNLASRRSRQSRKEREQEMAKMAEQLTKENAELRQKVTALEELRDSVKAELMKVLSGRK